MLAMDVTKEARVSPLPSSAQQTAPQAAQQPPQPQVRKYNLFLVCIKLYSCTLQLSYCWVVHNIFLYNFFNSKWNHFWNMKQTIPFLIQWQWSSKIYQLSLVYKNVIHPDNKITYRLSSLDLRGMQQGDHRAVPAEGSGPAVAWGLPQVRLLWLPPWRGWAYALHTR